MSWVGGKKALREEVVCRFPPEYQTYVEVFGGAGWVLFHKEPGRDKEVWNDYNSNLVNLYRCVRGNSGKLKYKLWYVLNSREDFNWLAGLHKKGIFSRFRDYDRAAKFYQLIRYSYGSNLGSFGSQPHSMWADFPQIDRASRRLQTVVIENQDFETLIQHYQGAGTFFYCDPPYYNTESYYKDVNFTRKDHICLRDALLNSGSKFLVSYNDCPEIRELWDVPGVQMESIRRLNNLTQKYESGSMYDEVLIANYDTTERSRGGQMSFLDAEEWEDSNADV